MYGLLFNLNDILLIVICHKSSKVRDISNFTVGDFVVANLDPEIYMLPTKPLLCKIRNISEDGQDIEVGFCEGIELQRSWFNPIKGPVQFTYFVTKIVY